MFWCDLGVALQQLHPANPCAAQGQAAGAYATLQCRLLCNIGVVFLNQGLYADARDNFEAVQRLQPHAACAFNRLLCSYMITTSVEQADALKLGFKDLLRVPQARLACSRPTSAAPPTPAQVLCSRALRCKLLHPNPAVSGTCRKTR